MGGRRTRSCHRLAERYGSGRVFLAGTPSTPCSWVRGRLVVLLLGYTAGTVLFIVARRERNQQVYPPAELVPLVGAVGSVVGAVSAVVSAVVGAVGAVVGLVTGLISI